MHVDKYTRACKCKKVNQSAEICSEPIISYMHIFNYKAKQTHKGKNSS